MEIPRLGVELELQLLAYATATATPDPSRVATYTIAHSKHQILNPLSKARGRTHNLRFPSWIRFHCTTMVMFSYQGSGALFGAQRQWGRGVLVRLRVAFLSLKRQELSFQSSGLGCRVWAPGASPC